MTTQINSKNAISSCISLKITYILTVSKILLFIQTSQNA